MRLHYQGCGAVLRALYLVIGVLTSWAGISPVAHAQETEPGPGLAGLTLPDHLGHDHDVGAEAKDHLCLVFDVGRHALAKRWDDALSKHLPAERSLVRIIDGSAVAEEDRPRLIERLTKAVDGTPVRFLLDWKGEVRRRLVLDADTVMIVSCNDRSIKSGQTHGTPNADGVTRALALLSIVPTPPLQDPPSQRGR